MERIAALLRRSVAAGTCLLSALMAVGAQEPRPAAAQTRQDALTQGYKAYRSKDWEGAALFLRKAVSAPEQATPDALYLLVMSQVYAGDHGAVVADADTFLSRYPDDPLCALVQYQRGRALCFLGRNDEAVLDLSDFCHQYPQHPLYGSALFYLGECFYADYNYDTARSLYGQVISDYPQSGKAEDATARLAELERDEREQKLLYLLKVTGEEYLSSREHYEQQLRQYQTGDQAVLRQQLDEANGKVAALEQRLREPQPAEASAAAPATGVSEEDFSALKEKAETLRRLLDGGKEDQ